MPKLTTKTLVGIIITIGIYTAFVLFSDLSLLIHNFQSFNLIYLPFAFLLITISYFIRAMRWNMFLKHLTIDIQLKKSFLIFFAGLGLGMTPGKLGEVIKSHFLKRDYNHSISKTVPIVFVERYYDLVGIIFLSLFGVWFVNTEKITVIIIFLLVIITLVISQQKKLLVPLLEKIGKLPLLKKFVYNALEIYKTIQILLSRKLYAKSTGYSIAAWLVESTAVFLIFMGFGIDLTFPIILFIFSFSSIIGAASMLPGGIGVTEGGMIGLLLLQNIDYTMAFSVVLLVRIVTLWFSVVLGLIALKKLTNVPIGN